MTDAYHFHPSLLELVEIQAESIVSRSLFEDETVKIIVFGFAAKQELSEHTSSRSAMIHIISGSAELTVGDDRYEVEANAWLQMSPRLPHSILAKTDMIMLLYMMKG